MSRKSRERRAAAVRAAKERRKKLLAFGGLGVLVVVLLIQGPRMLELFGGSTAAAPPPPPAAGTETQEEEEAKPPQLGSASAPFAVRRLVSSEPAAGSVEAPAGTRDPFRSESVSSAAPAPVSVAPAPKPAAPPLPSLPNQIVLGTPKKDAVARRGWIVVIASIPTRSGRASANRFATQVRRNGLETVGVLESSTRKPLRAGYYVVYNGPYPTRKAVDRAVAHIRALGYRTAYVRPILRY
jgi:hypothetical protein